MAGPMSLLEELERESQELRRRRKGKQIVRREGERKFYAEPEPDLGWTGIGPPPGEPERFVDLTPTRSEYMEETYGPKRGRNVENIFKKDYGTGMTGRIPDSVSPEKRLRAFRDETGLDPSVLGDEEYNRYVGSRSRFNLPPRLDYEEVPADDGFGPSIKRTGDAVIKTTEVEEVDPDGMSMESEEVLEEIRAGADKPRRTVETPRKLSSPAAVLSESRETGEPWQDILVNYYIDANPWLDQHKVRKAVYSVADKHYAQWKKDNDGSSYSQRLRRDFQPKTYRGRGRGAGRKGSKGRGSLATQMLNNDPELKRLVNILGDAKKLSGNISQSEMRNFMSKIAQDSEGKIEDASAAEEAMRRSLGKRELTADSYVDVVMRMYETGPEDQKRRFNRSSVQSMVQKKLYNNVLDLYNAGDPQITRLVEKYQTGKKPGKPAFNGAASELFMRYGLDDVSLTRGKRGAGDEFKRKQKNQ